MTEVSALPQVAEAQYGEYPSQKNKVERIGTDLVRTPDTDCYKIGSEDPNMLCASMKMPNPEQVIKGISFATSVVIGLKSFVEACGDFWKSFKDNFRQHKTEEIVNAQYRELAMQEAA